MKYPGVLNDELYKSEARKLFDEFLHHAAWLKPNGFLHEEKGRKVYSFESYLRATGMEESLIAVYCIYAKANKLMPRGGITDLKTIKLIAITMFWGTGVAAVLYPLISFIGSFFNWSWWSWKGFIYWTTATPGLILLVWILLFLEAGRKTKSTKPLPVIKYCDNDELGS
jgi:hypothetical protein